MIPYHSYLRFDDILSILDAAFGFEFDTYSLMLHTPKQAWCIIAGAIASNQCYRSGFLTRLPPGCSVKRGFSIMPDDYVSVADQHKILSICTMDGQNYMFEMKLLMDLVSGRVLNPDA